MKPAVPRVLSALVFLLALWWAHQHWQGDFLDQLSSHPFRFVLVFAATTLLALPATPLAVLAGSLFGPWLGTVLVGLAAYSASLVTFLLRRYWLRPLALQLLGRYPKMARYDQAFRLRGARTVFLLRLSPLIPYNVSNYAFGATSVALPDYLFGNTGMLVHIIALVCLGESLRHPSLEMFLLFGVLTVGSTWAAARAVAGEDA